MNAADLARLDLAKRAYQAAQPSASEVQSGVRRARLSLRRPKPRRIWLIKGLVFVVLAAGSLAYAKPHALAELVQQVLPQGDHGAVKHGVRLGAPVVPEPTKVALKSNAAHSIETSAVVVEPVDKARADAASASKRTALAPHAAKAVPERPSVRPAPSPAEAEATEAVSDWGRVGQALARGDEAKALSALNELSESDDQRTRDKADLGRAQLLMAHGNSNSACSLARSLTTRRAGSHIERQAQVLLKSCTR